MVTRADVIAEALTWLDTPWQHGQATRGVATDCVGLPLGIAKGLGLVDLAYTPPLYTDQWHLHKQRGRDEQLLEVLRQFPLREVALSSRRPGDLLVFRWSPRRPCGHLGLFMPGEQVLHARAGDDTNRVVLQPLHGRLLAMVATVMVLTMLEDA
jgi:NlpC/P60 family putative phage cell wall peptidase